MAKLVIKLLPVANGSTRFYDFDEFERLVAAAQVMGPPLQNYP
jgi:hypothetical protein